MRDFFKSKNNAGSGGYSHSVTLHQDANEKRRHSKVISLEGCCLSVYLRYYSRVYSFSYTSYSLILDPFVRKWHLVNFHLVFFCPFLLQNEVSAVIFFLCFEIMRNWFSYSCSPSSLYALDDAYVKVYKSWLHCNLQSLFYCESRRSVSFKTTATENCRHRFCGEWMTMTIVGF